MNPRRLVSKRAAVAAAAALVVAVGAGAAIAAATDAFDPQAERDAFQAAVAKKLGVTTKQLEDAYKAAALERLDAAVAAGRITKAQADVLRERIESGDYPGPGFGLRGPGMHGGGKHLAAAAEYLGLDIDALVEKLRSGQSLAEVAKAEGKSVEGLKQAILADAKSRLDQAVKDGRITDAQRDAMLERLEAGLEDIVNGTGPCLRGGPGGGPGFGHGFGRGPGFGFHDGAFGGGMVAPPDA